MESLPAVLIVDDDSVTLHTMQEQLSRGNRRVTTISSVAEALQRIRVERFGIIMADQFLPEASGLEFLRVCRSAQPLSSRLLMTGMEPVSGIEEAIERGDAFRVLRKPWTEQDLQLALNQAADRYSLMEQVEALTRETRRQQSDLAALGRQLESYRRQGPPAPDEPPSGSSLIEKEEIFRQLTCHLEQAVSLSDPESNRILYLSPVHEQIWGRPLEELSGKDGSWLETIHPQDRERVLKAALEGQGTGAYDQQYRILRPDGEVRWIRDRAFPIQNGRQKLSWMIGVAEDITDRKFASDQLEMRVRERTEEFAWANLALESEIAEKHRAEIRLRESNQKLQKALEVLHRAQQQVVQQERLQAFAKMVAEVADHLDNALVSIHGYAKLLIERPGLLDDRAMALKYLQLTRAAAKNATVVVDRLREFDCTPTGAKFFEPLDLVEAVTEAISMTHPRWHDEALAQGNRIVIERELEPVPAISGQGEEIREIFTNLIFNAVDALPEGGKIVIRTCANEQNAVFEIQDNGIGMPDEVSARCLDPFVTTKIGPGAGLGLAIVNGIAQRHRGGVEIESRLGEGTLVRVSLPFYQGLHESSLAGGSSQVRRLRILLVDNEEVIREVISLFLRHQGHEVEVTSAAIEALRMVREEKFDLVIADQAMPGVSNGNFAATLRSAGFDLPVLMLTGLGEMVTTSETVPRGELVKKPITMEELRSAIAALLTDSEVP